MDKVDRLIQIVRTLKEEGGPTMSLGVGKIAGTVEAGDDPPIDLRKRNTKRWNIFFKNIVRRK
jgi:hypothetical protein